MPTGQLRFYVTLAFAADVTDHRVGVTHIQQDGLGLASSLPRVTESPSKLSEKRY